MERTLQFGLRILFGAVCALVTWPVAAEEARGLFAPDSTTARVEILDIVPADIPQPIPSPPSSFQSSAPLDLPTLVASRPEEGELSPIPGPAPNNSYWIVSSRGSVQTIYEASRGPWTLDVYQRFSDGQMIPSNLGTLRSQLDPNLPVCIFAHGSFVKWESQCKESHEFYRRLAACHPGPLQVIFFTWPSDGSRTHLFTIDVAVRGRRADFNGFHLGNLLTQIPETCPVTLIGHSHGGRLILSTMHMAGGGTIEGHYFPFSMGQNRRFRVILAAGALDHNWLNPGEVYQCALNRVECLLNLQNRGDRALAFYPLSRPFAHRAIARSGITQRDYSLLGYNAAKVRDVDVTDVVGPSHFWPQYYSQPAVIGTILPYLYY